MLKTSLLTANVCLFDKCGLHFANLYDLIHHVEEVHGNFESLYLQRSFLFYSKRLTACNVRS